MYADVFQPEWDEVAFLMDAREMRISRMVDTNDYYGDPMLKTFDVADLPTKDTVGKELSFTSKVHPETQQLYHAMRNTLLGTALNHLWIKSWKKPNASCFPVHPRLIFPLIT